MEALAEALAFLIKVIALCIGAFVGIYSIALLAAVIVFFMSNNED